MADVNVDAVRSSFKKLTSEREKGCTANFTFYHIADDMAYFGCFSPSRFSPFHYNTMRKAIKAHKNLHTNQQNEHTPEVDLGSPVI